MSKFKKIEELKKYWLKNVKIICHNGIVLEGVFDGFVRAEDNESEQDSLDLHITLYGKNTLYGINLDEIESIEIID